MRIFQINGGVFGSTGKIMFGIWEAARKQGHEVLCAAPVTKTNRKKQPKEPYIKIGTYYGRCLSVLFARLTGWEGCFALLPTCRLIRQIKKFSPDVLHLHSIHNAYLNIPMLFRYIKRNHIRVLWTLHDCWAMTGHCTHFEGADCEKWKSCCGDCPRYHDYPKSYFDNSRAMHRRKKRWFLGVEDMTLIVPSFWLAESVKQSFLRGYPLKVIPNGIDLTVFHPRESDFRKRHRWETKKIVLGVAFGWNRQKGLDVFIGLSRRLDDRYRIVLVGTDDRIDSQLPPNILSIPRTQDQQELAELYTAADVFVNPTREDTYPTVNMEAIACGTPVVTFRTGGSPESVADFCGSVVEKEDIQGLETEIRRICEDKAVFSEACMEQAKQFDRQRRYAEIVELYGKQIRNQRRK